MKTFSCVFTVILYVKGKNYLFSDKVIFCDTCHRIGCWEERFRFMVVRNGWMLNHWAKTVLYLKPIQMQYLHTHSQKDLGPEVTCVCAWALTVAYMCAGDLSTSLWWRANTLFWLYFSHKGMWCQPFGEEDAEICCAFKTWLLRNSLPHRETNGLRCCLSCYVLGLRW